jgi:hypothetical protein
VGVTLIEFVLTLAEYEKVQPLKVGDKTPADNPSADIRASRMITLFELAVVDPTELVFVILKLIVLPTSLA